MTAFSAKDVVRQSLPRSVVFIVYPDIVLLDLAGPLEVFSWARHGGTGALAYETAIVSLDGGRIPTDTIVSVESEKMEDWAHRQIDTLVIVGGDGAYETMNNTRMVKSVSALAERSQRVCSVCSGALILASAGLLDGRRATTHWEDCAQLTESFPNVRVEADPIYVKDGHVWTSAGVTAGTDMALAIVAEDLGQDAALERAQKLVTYMVRPGGQSQFSPALERQKRDRSAKFADLHQWIGDNLKTDLRVEQLAEKANMSVRSFHRQYAVTMGLTPARAVEKIRMEVAREFLETTSVSMKSVADTCGFGDEERMRRAFLRLIGVSPSEYRKRFQIGDGH